MCILTLVRIYLNIVSLEIHKVNVKRPNNSHPEQYWTEYLTIHIDLIYNTFSYEIKRHLFLGKKATTNLDSILKSSNVTMLTKFCIVKAMVFPVVMYVDESYRRESWTIKKAEHQRIDAFELLGWKRLLRVPRTAKRSKQSILKEINPEYYWKNWYWSWNSNTLTTWCEELTHWKRPWCCERLKAGREGWEQRMRWLDSITNSRDMNLSKLWETVEERSLACCNTHGHKELDTT